MNTAVIDATVQVGWLLPDEPWHSPALAIADLIADGRLDAIAAPNSRFEVCNALVTAARRGRIEWHEIGERLATLDAVGIRVDPEPYPIDEVLRVCRDHLVGWGDAHHALAAQRSRRPLLTADARLVRALQGSDIWVESILDLPMGEDQ
jgi:predicted nucleic acid-binding protein